MEIKKIGNYKQNVAFEARKVTPDELRKIWNYCDNVFKTTADYPCSLLNEIECATRLSSGELLSREQAEKLTKMIGNGTDILLGSKDKEKLSKITDGIYKSIQNLRKEKIITSLLDEKNIIKNSGLYELYENLVKQGLKKPITIDSFEKAANKIDKIEKKSKKQIQKIRDNII